MFEWHVVAEAFRVPKICHEQRRTVQKFSHKSSDTSRVYKRRAAGSDIKGDQSAILRDSHRNGGKPSRDWHGVDTGIHLWKKRVHGFNYYTGICARHAEIVWSYRRNGVFATSNRNSEQEERKFTQGRAIELLWHEGTITYT